MVGSQQRLSPSSERKTDLSASEEEIPEGDTCSFTTHSPNPNGNVEVDGNEDDDDDDSDECRDEFSVSLAENSASYVSEQCSVATDDQSCQSFQSYGTSGGASSIGQNTESEGDSVKIARKEATAARWSRVMAVSILLLLATLLPFTLFRMASNAEVESFQNDFGDFSDKVGTDWQANVEHTFAALDALAVDLTLATSTAVSTWPFVTVPKFPIWSTNARYLADAIVSNSLAPLVTSNQREDYENYTLTNGDWIFEAVQWRGSAESYENDRRHLQLVDFSDGFADQIYEIKDGKTVVAEGAGPFYPVRHIDPINARSINYNLVSNSYLKSGIDGVVEKTAATLGPVLESDLDSSVLEEIFSAESNGDLFGTMTYPILDSLGVNGQVVGLLASLISWNTLFEDILPSHAQGVICVVQNSCFQLFTIQIDGPYAEFLGYEDLHDKSYDSFGRTYDLVDLDLQKVTASRITFDDYNSCGYTLSVYPSATTKSSYETNTPTMFALISLATFVLTLAVICIYDCIQERRNSAILRSALEARAIVSSLFPAVVRDRLFETNRENEKQKKEKKKTKKTKKKNKGSEISPDEIVANGGALGPIDQITTDSPVSDDMERAPRSTLSPTTVQKIMEIAHMPLDENEESSSSRKKGTLLHPKHRLKNFLEGAPSLGSDEFGLGKPIADLFPYTTVLFADIVGFTAWSSEREPEQVFTLLQTVYHAFDRVAKRRSVFKVETIGDCYVAVTGLPDPQPDHAVRMCKFARECMTKMAEVTKKLEMTLGPDTGDLCMRLGLNSGPVTAGVLQGEKSRFQLFGDTVNTASRMESTGERNKIQVSKSTADFLIEAGKSYWVKPREELVHAKGKGQVQTYWVVARTGAGSGLQGNRSSEGCALMGEPRRMAPPRTRSAFGSGEPMRGVKRTTSDFEGW
jgi:class 3 adenylate cyclase